MPKTTRVPRVLVLIETSRAYGRGLLRGIGRYTSEHGPWSIYCEERGLPDPLPSWVADWHGDGIISRTSRLSDVNALESKRLPFVELLANPRLGLRCVFPNLKRIAELAADHLLSLGLRNFGFFASENAWWIDMRRDDFISELAARGHSCSALSPKSFRPREDQQEAEERDVADWLESLTKPCGIFCASDLYAMRLLDVCRNHGVAVPEQIAVLGVDNDPVICSVSFPPLSSIDVASPRVGYESASLLDRLMAGRAPEDNVTWVEPGQIVARQSTDILAIDNAEVAHAVRFIREHACRGVSVQDVADAAAISRRGLERRFIEFLDRSPKDEIMRVRMERAKMLLRQTDLAIETVSRKSGFSSFKYFSRVFRHATGVTPRAFRKTSRVPGLDSPAES